ncbi:MAG: MFS transporter [Candidatus Sericytochromatia bacterium]|nr:MFS transporter [Candidatus Sericytochromatia bacterium]
MRRAGRGLGLDGLDLVACGQAAAVHAALPVLPLVAREAGGDTVAISAMVTASMLSGLLTHVPGGWLADRVGRRPVLLVGLVLHAVVAVMLLFGVGGLSGLVPLRALEGVAAALATTAALALAAEQAPPSARGSRVARLTGAQSAGYALGPALGMPFLAFGPKGAFAAACALAVASMLIACSRTEGGPSPATEDAGVAGPSMPTDTAATLRIGVLALLGIRALGGGLVVGMYEATWADFMLARGATSWLISASWAIFALPPVLLAAHVGRSLDRFGPVLPLAAGSGLQAVAVASYPHWSGAALPLVSCVVEGVGFAWSMPAQHVLAVQASPGRLRGRVLGALGACVTGGVIVGAWFFPWLQAHRPDTMFVVSALAMSLPALPFLVMHLLKTRQQGGLHAA